MLDDVQRPILDALLVDVEAAEGSQPALVAFRENLAAILNDAQRARLPEVWAVIYKERMESAGTVAGEAVDIGALAREVMRGESSDALDKRIAEYRKDLDPLLKSRGDAQGVELVRIRLAIREVNDQARTLIGATLPDADAARFRAVALAKGYPTAFAPSRAMRSLDAVLKELPVEPLRALSADATKRYAALCERGMAAVRARDNALVRDAAAVESAAAAIADAEAAYDQFESWLIRQIVEVGTQDALAATPAGRAVLEQLKANEQGADHAWHDSGATIKKFDKNADGQIDGDEATAALDAFTKSVGRQVRRRL